MSDAVLGRLGRVLAAYAFLASTTGVALYLALGLAGQLVQDWVLHNAVGGFAIGLLVWLVVKRQARNAAVWALLTSGAFQATNVLALGFGQLQLARLGLPGELSSLVPAELPLLTALTLQVTNWVWVPGMFLLLTLALLLFPDGRLPSPRWKWVTRLTIASITLTSLVFAWVGRPASQVASYADVPINAVPAAVAVMLVIGFGGLFVSVGAALVALARRSRASAGTEREQFRWIGWGAAVMGIATLLLIPTLALELISIGYMQVATAAALPVFIASYVVAVTRYRLYEIDRLVSRTASYALVTASLGLGYLGLILSLQLVLAPFTGGSEIAVAASTVAVTAAFRPVHARAQSFVDRRFNRAAYDARRTVEAFAHSLRDDVELDMVREHLAEVAAATVHPLQASVWLLDDGRQDGSQG